MFIQTLHQFVIVPCSFLCPFKINPAMGTFLWGSFAKPTNHNAAFIGLHSHVNYLANDTRRICAGALKNTEKQKKDVA